MQDKTSEPSDITGRIHQLYETPPTWADKDNLIPMFSFSRPAYVLWQAVFSSLVRQGWTETDAIEWLQSKGPRHALDGYAHQLITEVGDKIAANADRSYIR